MNRIVPSILTAILTLVCFSGCATKHPLCGTEALANLPASPVTVWASEPELAKKIVIGREKVEEGPNGALIARVEIANVSGEDLPIDVQTLYKDLSGWTLNRSPWVRHNMGAGKKVWLMAPTIAPGTARFFILIQPAAPGRPKAGLGLPNI